MKLIYNLTIRVLPFITLLLFSFRSYAQQSPLSKQPPPDLSVRNLKIGDKVPDILITKLINYKSKQARMTDFKNKLLILDFWDTYCGSCIQALPKLDSLQRAFGNKISILPVTYQREALVRAFLKKNPNVKNLQLPCVVEDKVLRAHFRHRFISHEVWIYKGIVKAITGTEYVTEANIQKVLNGEKINWPIKDDEFGFDSKKPLFIPNEAKMYESKTGFSNHSGMTGYRKGIAIGGMKYDSLQYRTYFYNFSILDAYTSLLTGIDQKKFIVGTSRIVLEGKSPSVYFYTADKGFEEEWNEKYKFCYEMVMPGLLDKKERYKLIVNDLNNRLSLNVRFEKRWIKCLVFIQNPYRIPNDSTRVTEGGVSIPDIAFFEIDYASGGTYPPAVDETNFKGKIKLNPYDGTLEGLRKEIQRHGFDIIEAKREMEVLVITETKPHE